MLYSGITDLGPRVFFAKVWLGPVPLQRCGLAWLGLSPCKGVAWLCLALLGLAWLGSAWPGLARLRLGLARLGFSRFGLAPLGLARLGLPRSAEVGLLGTALACLARLGLAWLDFAPC